MADFSKLTKAHMQVLLERMNSRVPVPQPQDPMAGGMQGMMPPQPQMGMQGPPPGMQPPGMMPQGPPTHQMPDGSMMPGAEHMEAAGMEWDEMQDGIGPSLYEGMRAESPMDSGMYPSGRDSFVGNLAGMAAGAGKRDPAIQQFIHELMQSKDKRVIPGYGIGDEADEEVANAFYGMGG